MASKRETRGRIVLEQTCVRCVRDEIFAGRQVMRPDGQYTEICVIAPVEVILAVIAANRADFDGADADKPAPESPAVEPPSPEGEAGFTFPSPEEAILDSIRDEVLDTIKRGHAFITRPEFQKPFVERVADELRRSGWRVWVNLVSYSEVLVKLTFKPPAMDKTPGVDG